MLSLKLAWRNLFRNTRRTVLTSILIGSSLFALILVDGLTLGMADIMVGGITHTLEGEAQVNRKGFRDHLEAELRMAYPGELEPTISASESVAGLAPRVIVGGMVASSHNTVGGLIYGVDANMETRVSRIRDALIAGEYLSGGKREILVGKRMADLLEVELGDRIIITAAAVETHDIAQELFRVSGVFEFGPEELDESLVFINLPQAQSLLGMPGQVHQVALRFKNPEDAKNADLPILAQLNSDEIEALGWLDLQPSMGAMIEMTGYSTAIVAGILFVLTSLGVINAMFMSIYERIYEFGVAKAIGTAPKQIMGLVMFEALLLALLACAAGLVCAFLASYYFQENGVPVGKMEFSGVVFDGNIRTKAELYQFITFPIYVTALTLVAAIYPAIFAARIVPSNALQRAL